jgi:hypothetical protein
MLGNMGRTVSLFASAHKVIAHCREMAARLVSARRRCGIPLRGLSDSDEAVDALVKLSTGHQQDTR